MKTPNTQKYPLLSGSRFQFINVNPTNISDLESRIIRAYKQVFNASSWREGVRCVSATCKFKTTFEESPVSCPDCSDKIVDFYSDGEVSQAIRGVIDKSCYQILALMTQGEVVGFSWGWKDSLETINQEKLGLDIEQFGFLKAGLTMLNIDPQGTFYYLSEVGIVPKCRQKGIGATITSISYDEIKEITEINATIVRTSRDSPMYPIQEKVGSKVVFSYNDLDNRIILSQKNS